MNTDTLSVQILKSTPDIIEFNYTNESIINVLNKSDIEKIIYSGSRIEICNERITIPQINSKKDWEKVLITFNEYDIAGLTYCDTIIGMSGLGGINSKIGGEDAIKAMKKRAAKMGAPIILIVDGWHKEKNKPISGFGRGVKLTGIAYKKN